MTSPAVVRQECGRKQARYRSEDGASRAISRRRRLGADPERLLHAYLCPHCDGWHIGHPRGIGRRAPDPHDGLSEANEELFWRVIPFMRRSAFAGPHAGWQLIGPFQDHTGRWQALLQGPTRAKQVWSNRNCPTAAVAVRDLATKARASRWWAPNEIGGRTHDHR